MKVPGFDDLGDLTLLMFHKFLCWFLVGSDEGRLAKLIENIAYAIFRHQRQIIAARLSLVFSNTFPPHYTMKLAKKIFQNRWVNREIFWLKVFSCSAYKR